MTEEDVQSPLGVVRPPAEERCQLEHAQIHVGGEALAELPAKRAEQRVAVFEIRPSSVNGHERHEVMKDRPIGAAQAEIDADAGAEAGITCALFARLPG